jgi:hypothetical protein
MKDLSLYDKFVTITDKKFSGNNKNDIFIEPENLRKAL